MVSRSIALMVAVVFAQPTTQLAAQDDGPPIATASGCVLVNETNEPVSGAVVKLVAGGKSPWGEPNTIEVSTDESGKFESPIPLGHGWFARLSLPTGYWMGSEFPEKFTSSPATPTVSKNYRVHRGYALSVKLLGASGSSTPQIWVGISQQDGNRQSKTFFMASAACDAEGRARVTVPAGGGDLVLSCGGVSEFEQVKLSGPVKLTLEADFNPDHVVSVYSSAEPNTTVIQDAAGHEAHLTGASARITDGKVEVTLPYTRSVAPATGALKGRVVDENGVPVNGAKVALAFVSRGRLSISDEGVHRVRTDDAGEFHIARVPTKHHVFDMSEVGLIVKKEGFGACEVKPFPLQAKEHDEIQRVATICLERAATVKLLLVNAAGKPLTGAWLEPTGDTAVNTLFAKTDRSGHCEFNQLPDGYHRVIVSHGAMYDRITLAVTRQAVETVMLLSVRDLGKLQQRSTVRVPIKPGQTAPEWSIHEWTDGKPRNLANYRGKVVFLEFWGVWCGQHG